MAPGRGQLLNGAGECVGEMLEGLLLRDPGLVRLGGDPRIKVLMRRDWPAPEGPPRVALVAGGGSGHEPAHAGYIGQGMLTAAVLGEVFASPSVDAVLEALRACGAGPRSLGVLLVVKNYTGDRLNFGIAAEAAKAEGIAVEMVVVGEDVALPDPGLAGRRGLAGVCFVEKVAGALAESRAPLSEVAAAARRVAAHIGTMGAALSVCNVPGQQASERLEPGQMELGLGIHGEPGAEKRPAARARDVVRTVLERVAAGRADEFWRFREGDAVALMVNNLGGATEIELSVLAREAVAACRERGLIVQRLLARSFVTSLDMHGFSLSLLKLDDDHPLQPKDLSLLDAPTRAPAWPHPRQTAVVGADGCKVEGGGGSQRAFAGPAKPLEAGAGQELSATEAEELGGSIRRACQALLDDKLQERLNELDLAAGDGDCGATHARGAGSILAELERGGLPLSRPAETFLAMGKAVRRDMGGTAGACYDILFAAAGAALSAPGAGGDAAGGGVAGHWDGAWAHALYQGALAVSRYGGATKGDRTMLDALLPFCATLDSEGGTVSDALRAADEGAAATASMKGGAGRAGYVPAEQLEGVMDPGALAVSVWLRAALVDPADGA